VTTKSNQQLKSSFFESSVKTDCKSDIMQTDSKNISSEDH